MGAITHRRPAGRIRAHAAIERTCDRAIREGHADRAEVAAALIDATGAALAVLAPTDQEKAVIDAACEVLRRTFWDARKDPAVRLRRAAILAANETTDQTRTA